MNSEYFKIDDNNFFVSDENGKIEVIHIGLEKNVVNDILLKENKFEELSNLDKEYDCQISLLLKKLKEKDINIKNNKLYLIVSFCVFCLSFFGVGDYMFFVPIFVISGSLSCYLIMKQNKNNRELSNLKLSLSSVNKCKKINEGKMHYLEKELGIIKKLVSYEKIPAKKEKIELFNKIKNNDKGNVKVLKRVK